MKIFKHLFILGAISTALLSCKKDSTNNGGGGTTTNSMSAKVGGVSWSAGTAVQATKQGTVLVLAGTGNGAQINITLGAYSGTGTYNINNTNTSNSATYTVTSSNPAMVYGANAIFGSGSVNVTSDANNVIEGSFQFTALNEGSLEQKAITGGAFKIKY